MRERHAGHRGFTLRAVACLIAAYLALHYAPQLAIAIEVGLLPGLVSISVRGTPDAASGGPAANADGTVLAFYSDATNLIAGDTNRVRDVFVAVADAPTERVSVSSSGTQANGPSHAAGGSPAISADGNIIAFYSSATNLVPGDTNGWTDIFVRDRAAGSTDLVSVSSDEVLANGPSFYPSLSADGNLVAFQSQASNLVPDDTNNTSDIFVRDRAAGTTERLCGVQPNNFSFTPSISPDGSCVAFASRADNLVAGDTNNAIDIFVCDLASGVIERVSVSSDGTQGNGDSILPDVSNGCEVVVFKSLANNLVAGDRNDRVDVFARDRTTGTTERISVGLNGADADDVSFPPSICDDGRFVAFGSWATNLVPFDINRVSDVFVRDRLTGLTVLVNLAPDGSQANRGTVDAPPAISGDCRRITFVSLASNLAGADSDTLNVFVVVNPLAPAVAPTETPATATETPLPATETPTVSPTAVPTDAEPTPSETAAPLFTITPTETAPPEATATTSPSTTPTQVPATATETASATQTLTGEATATVTGTGTATAEATASATTTLTATETAVVEATATPSMTAAVATATQTAIAATATSTVTAATATETATASTPTASVSPTVTPVETGLPGGITPGTATPTPSASVSATSAVATATTTTTATSTEIAATPTGTASVTASSTASVTVTATASSTETVAAATATASATATLTASGSPTGSATASISPTASPTQSPTTTPVETGLPGEITPGTATPTASGSPTPSVTPSNTTAVATATQSSTATISATPSQTPSTTETAAPATATASASPSPSATASPTFSSVPTLTSTPLPTATDSPSPTLSPTASATLPPPSPTSTESPTVTATASVTATLTGTVTPTATASVTETATATLTPSASPTFTLPGGGAGGESCTGDCDHDGEVTVDNLITGLNISLDVMALDACPSFDMDGNDAVSIDELLTGVNHLLTGCP